MAIYIISTLKQANNGNFPLIDSNDIKGGLYSVDTLEDLQNIPSSRLKQGMLAWISNLSKYYKYTGTTWSELILSSESSSAALDVNSLKDHLKLQITTNTISLYYDSTLINAVSVKLQGKFDQSTEDLTLNLVSSTEEPVIVNPGGGGEEPISYSTYNATTGELSIDSAISSYDSSTGNLTISSHNSYDSSTGNLTID